MENKICEVHKIALINKKVPIRYGLYDPEPELDEAKRILFPNAHTYISGGCEIQDEYQAEIKVCNECLKDEAEWRILTK
ncbi:MAG TPA: hypothetical protein PKY59_07560 [Pyrinomonadaceae bacterium]|nr:hypothetical protein [Pyrinomonadaceae bacterium]